MLANIAENTKKGGVFIYAWVELFLSQTLYEVHITKYGNNFDDLIEIQKGIVHPYTIFKFIEDTSKSEVQVCFNNSCLKPEKETSSIINQINQIII
jgi:hypothetical protein